MRTSFIILAVLVLFIIIGFFALYRRNKRQEQLQSMRRTNLGKHSESQISDPMQPRNGPRSSSRHGVGTSRPDSQQRAYDPSLDPSQAYLYSNWTDDGHDHDGRRGHDADTSSGDYQTPTHHSPDHSYGGSSSSGYDGGSSSSSSSSSSYDSGSSGGGYSGGDSGGGSY